MYGLLLEAICQSVKANYGEKALQEVLIRAGIPHQSFSNQKVYSESIISRLTKAAQDVTGTTVNVLMDHFGDAFVVYVGQFGYDRILKVLGRNMRDFLNGLDNLHEYLRFSYPKLKPPSFFCENEHRQGLTLHYRSKRKGFIYYVMGQIKAVGKHYYNTPVEIDIIREDDNIGMTHVVMKLNFDNTAYDGCEQDLATDLDSLHLSSDMFFDVFPFHIVFTRTMVIRSVGAGLLAVMPGMAGHAIDEMFNLVRPLVEFTLENVLMHTNNVFELYSADVCRRVNHPMDRLLSDNDGIITETDADSSDDGMGRHLCLKGQMMYMKEWDAVIFLGTPIMENLDRMFETGLYINDLSLHDSSRDLVLAGTQQSAELKLALDQEQQKSKKLEESMRKLDLEMRRTDSLLYQMIPKTVADRLRKGEPAVNTCEVFDKVTILFSDVVGFTRICSQITPMAVVSMLNAMYTKFDKLSEKHRVYKVETIGDAYMVVSGAPMVTKFHALYIGDMAFDMLNTMADLIEPSSGSNMQIRVGIHSGTVVAGVVGLKMPRYCLFGETVNTASRMENHGEAMKIHISESTRGYLEGYNYTVEERGSIEVMGKGSMKTYWLLGKKNSTAGTDRQSTVVMDNNGHDTNGNLPTIIETDSVDANAGHVLYKPVQWNDGHGKRTQTSDKADSANGLTPRQGSVRNSGPQKTTAVRKGIAHVQETLVAPANGEAAPDGDQGTRDADQVTASSRRETQGRMKTDTLDTPAKTCRIL